jgi:hypothetical protein
MLYFTSLLILKKYLLAYIFTAHERISTSMPVDTAVMKFTMSFRMSVRSSIRPIDQREARWENFCGTWCLWISLNFFKTIQLWLKNRHFMWRPICIYFNIPSWLIFKIDIFLYEVQTTFEEEFYGMSINNQLTTQLVLTKRAILNQRTYRTQSNTYTPTLSKCGRKRLIFWNAIFLWNTKR